MARDEAMWRVVELLNRQCGEFERRLAKLEPRPRDLHAEYVALYKLVDEIATSGSPWSARARELVRYSAIPKDADA